MAESRTTRTMILENVQDRLQTRFSTEKGTTGQWLRRVSRGPWSPGNTVRPAGTVTDFGVTRSARNNSDITKGRVLAFHVVLDLEANWDREGVIQDWSDRVEQIGLAIQNFKAGPGMLRLDFIQDDPFEVVLENGTSEQIWILEFEAEYFIDVGAFG